MKRGNFGFTLIELLVAIGIIGLLAVFLVASYSRAQAKSRDGRRHADLAIISVALESYFNDQGKYPTEDEVVFGSQFNHGAEIYFKKLPNDPLYPKNKYCYEPDSDLLGYTLGADFETETRGCTEGANNPAPTATPEPEINCAGAVWVKIGEWRDECFLSNSEGERVGGNCESKTCGTEITYCHDDDPYDTCPIGPDPSPWLFSTGRRYTTCECVQL